MDTTKTSKFYYPKRVWFILLFLLYWAVVVFFCFCHIQNDMNNWVPREVLGIPIDKCIHFLMFIPYPFTAFWAFKGRNFVRSMALVFLSGIVLACLLEYGQGALTTYRSKDLLDLVANLYGIVIGSLILSLFKLFSKKKK